MSDPSYRPGTLALHAGQEPDSATNSRAVPIYATTSYTFNDTDHAANLFGLTEFGNIYSRLMNPTVDVLEKRLAALDGGVTGLVFRFWPGRDQRRRSHALPTAGQNFVAATSLYGGTWTLFTQTFKNLGIEVRFFDADNPEQIHGLVDENTRLRLHGVASATPQRRAGLQGHRRRGSLGPARPDPGHLRQHRDDAVCCSARSTTASTSSSTPPPSSSAATARTSAARSSTAATSSGPTSPRSGRSCAARRRATTARCSRSTCAPMGNISYNVHIRTHWLRDTGAAMSPFAAFLFLQGLRDAAPADAAPLRERPGGRQIPRGPRARSSG